MPVYVSDLFTATPAPVNAAPTSTRTWQWLRGSSAISGATSASYTAVTADIGSTLSATQLETNFLATTTATSAATETVQAFDPIRLFSASEPGVWYDPTDMSTLYQNATGTIPVTSFGQPVGLMLDKSRGGPGPELVTNGDFSSSTGWLLDSGATISGGSLSFNSVGSTLGANQADYPSIPTNGTAKIVVVVTSLTAGQFRVKLNNSALVLIPASVGTHTLFITAGSAPSSGLQILAAGTTTGTIDSVSLNYIPGLHATQSTDASRPLYGIVPVSGRRNLLTQTEAFNEAVWSKILSASVTANTEISPDGTMTADTILAGAAGSAARQTVTLEATPYTFSVWLKRKTGSGEIQISATGGAFIARSVSSSWERFTITQTPTAGANFPGVRLATSGDEVYVWGAQLETGSTPTAYQRVSTDLDVTEAGVASVGYLRFDGSTSWMVTPTITPGTDKVQVFAGVRKLSDAAVAALIETSTSFTVNAGTLGILAPSSVAPNYRIGAAGSTSAYYVPTGFPAPITNVLSVLVDIGATGVAAQLVPRINGVVTQSGLAGTDLGTGNFLAYPLYIGRRGGTTLPFNGQLFPIIVRFGPTLTAARIAATEAWVATKTGGVTL